jgi:predicted ATPase
VRPKEETKVPDAAFLKRVVLKNYRSIADCDVHLHSLMFLVGPNGSGKSNFLDGLRLVADSLRTSLDHALRERGGIGEVRRRSGGRPTNPSIRLEFVLHDGRAGSYEFHVGARQQGGYEVQREECMINPGEPGGPIEFYEVAAGRLVKSSRQVPAPSSDRLFLVSASGVVEFRPVFDALSRMGFYNLNPDRIRDWQTPDPGEMLNRDGSNLASVLREMKRQGRLKERVEEYLARVVPGLSSVDMITMGSRETIVFRQSAPDAVKSWDFQASAMSDGTLRALAILVSLFQPGNDSGLAIPLVGIEEPEVALPPAAAGILLDILREASRRTQVLVTSHSPDLLDDDDIEADSILAVTFQNGESKIAPMDDAGRSALRDRLCTAGDLLRQDQLRPRTDPPGDEPPAQISLFNKGEAR